MVVITGGIIEFGVGADLMVVVAWRWETQTGGRKVGVFDLKQSGEIWAMKVNERAVNLKKEPEERL